MYLQDSHTSVIKFLFFPFSLSYVDFVIRPANKTIREEGKMFPSNNPKRMKVEATSLLKLVLKFQTVTSIISIGQSKSQGYPKFKVLETRFCLSMKVMRYGNTKKEGKLLMVIISEICHHIPSLKIQQPTRQYTSRLPRIYIFGLFPISFFLFIANLSENSSYSLSPYLFTYHSYIDLS